MATVRETAARREAELLRRAESGESGREPVAPPVGDVIAGAIAQALRRLSRRWSALAAGRWWQRTLAAALAILAITAVCAVGVAVVYGLIHAPTVVIAAAGLLVFGAAFLRFVWWGFRR